MTLAMKEDLPAPVPPINSIALTAESWASLLFSKGHKRVPQNDVRTLWQLTFSDSLSEESRIARVRV